MGAERPSPNGENGRGANGRFVAGNKGGPGNPMAAKVGKLRGELLEAVSGEEIREVVAALVRKAKSGDVMAIRVLLDRVFGPPAQLDFVERLEALEERMKEPK